jgi:hypothetical protein
LLLDHAQPALDAGVGVERGDAVLDALKPLRDRADPAREALDVAGRGMCSAVNATSRAGPPSRVPRTRASAHGSLVVGSRELLGELPERIVTGDALAQALGGEPVVVDGRRR